jgi:LuxR family maltose regulon positive regulatory protein
LFTDGHYFKLLAMKANTDLNRPALFERLDASGRVTQVSAPAGSGKTALLRSWIMRSGMAGRVAWVAVPRATRDPQLFWDLVLEALRTTSAGAKLVGASRADSNLGGTAVVERLLQAVHGLRERLWLVIDDLHELHSDEARQDLELLLLAAPAVVRFVLASRHEVRLGTHRLRLAGELTEIRTQDLWFTSQESRALFTAAGVTLSEPALKVLQQRTEGWAAGLKLAALALAGHPDPNACAAEFGGSERTVAEYLLAEVLNRQSEAVKKLLLFTSVLERVNGALADCLTGGSAGQEMLRALEETNSFVFALDRERSWFRYHPLFAELLRFELRQSAPEQVDRLRAAAAEWCAAHVEVNEPIRAADPGRTLLEPLSESEIRILRYLPTHLSRSEIAAELYVSVNTVKTHMRNLFAKLDVHSRTNAVARARSIGLLGAGARPPRRENSSSVVRLPANVSELRPKDSTFRSHLLPIRRDARAEEVSYASPQGKRA